MEMAHLASHSEQGEEPLHEWLTRLGSLPRKTQERDRVKSSLRNVAPMEAGLHNLFDRKQVVFGPSPEEVRAMIRVEEGEIRAKANKKDWQTPADPRRFCTLFAKVPGIPKGLREVSVVVRVG